MTKTGGRFLSVVYFTFSVYTGCINIRTTNSEVIENIKTNIFKYFFLFKVTSLRNSNSLFTQVYRIVQHFHRERTMKMTLMEFAFCPKHSFPRLTDLEFVIEILICNRNINFFDNGILLIYGKRDFKKVSHRHRPACPLVVLSSRIFLSKFNISCW
jgi:hypothetical protein